MSRLRDKLYLADVVTTLVIILGFLSITIGSDPYLSSSLIIIAGILDAIDGILARRFGSSDTGLIYDSIADIIAFCLAPSVVIYEYINLSFGFEISLALSLFFLITTLLHMRIFIDKQAVIGCPTTVAALAVCNSILVGIPVIVGLVSVLFSLFVIPKFRYIKQLNTKVKVAVALVMLAGVITHFWLDLGLAFNDIFSALSVVLIVIYGLFGTKNVSLGRLG